MSFLLFFCAVFISLLTMACVILTGVQISILGHKHPVLRPFMIPVVLAIFVIGFGSYFFSELMFDAFIRGLLGGIASFFVDKIDSKIVNINSFSYVSASNISTIFTVLCFLSIVLYLFRLPWEIIFMIDASFALWRVFAIRKEMLIQNVLK